MSCVPHVPRRSLLVAALVCAASPALADRSLPSLPMSHSNASRDLYQELRMYDWGCPKVDEATKKAKLEHVEQVVAGITDDFDKKQFAGYATDLRAWWDAHDAGVPGVGTWAELEKKYRAAQAAFASMPQATPTGADQVTAALAVYATVRKQAKAIADLDGKLEGASPCTQYPGNWYQLVRDGADAVRAADQQISDATRPALDAYRTWQGTLAVLDEPTATTYWEHVKQTAQLVDLVTATQALAPSLADLAAWQPALTGDDAATAQGAAAAAAAALEQAGPRATAQLADVKMPALPKNAGRAKLLKKSLAQYDTGVQVGLVVSPKGTSKESWTEDVEVKRDATYVYTRAYKFVREWYSTYYAWKPAGAGDVCELWHESFYRYTKGSPQVSDQKKWGPYQSWKEGYIPCANVKATSKLKVKK